MSQIHSFEIERQCLSAIIRHPNLVADIEPFIKGEDFVSVLNKTVYQAVTSAHSQGEDINVFSIAEKIKKVGITFSEELDGNVLDYLEELKLITLTERGGMGAFGELKRLSVRREFILGAKRIAKEMENAGNASIDEIVALADKAYSTTIGSFQNNVAAKDFSNIYENLEEIIEERGNNPIEEVGYLGPFERCNKIYGSLLRPGNITLIGARTAAGKSSLGFYYLDWVSNKYNVPILHLDQGELSEFEIQIRAVSMLTNGKCPIHLIESGKWRQNPETERLVRDAWKVLKARKAKCHYKSVGVMSPDEIISTIRRFYLSKVGRGNQFLIHYDYIKAFDTSDTNTSEWQMAGKFIQNLKTLITTDNGVPASIWTSLQLNRSGIVGNKNSSLVDDTENTFSISERINQQVSHSFILRDKTMDELADWANFGNMNLIPTKTRHLGEEAHTALTPVRLADKSLKKNYHHIQRGSFVFTELGDLATTVDQQGILMKKGKNDEDEDEETIPRDVKRRPKFDDSDLIQ